MRELVLEILVNFFHGTPILNGNSIMFERAGEKTMSREGPVENTA
jgi:hypothetical protein